MFKNRFKCVKNRLNSVHNRQYNAQIGFTTHNIDLTVKKIEFEEKK